MAHSTVWDNVRRLALLSTLPIALTTLITDVAHAFGFTRTYVFGDSLSDTGNLFEATGRLLPPPPYEQRLSNGPVWVEYLAPRLGTPLTSLAIAGASTDDTNTTIPLLPGISEQVGAFTAANPQADSQALYIIWGGANDYLGGDQTNPSIPVANLTASILSLMGVGAKNIVVANLPDLGKLPGTSGNPAVSQGLSTLTSIHNSLLAQTLSLLRANSTLGTEVNLIPLDINALFTDAIANPASYGLSNVTDSCIFPPPLLNPGAPITVCDSPETYLFWDDIHPTTTTHAVISDFAFATIEAKAVPEPSATLGVFTFAAFLGGATVMKRRRQRTLVKLPLAECRDRQTKAAIDG